MNCRTGALWGGALHVERHTDHTQLSLKNSDEQVKNLQLKMRDQANKENLTAGVYSSLHPAKGSLLTKCSYFSYRKHRAHMMIKEIQSPWHLLEKQHSQLQALQFWSALRII